MTARRRRAVVFLAVTALAFVALYAGHPFVLRAMAGYLVVDDPLTPATAIVIMGGGVPMRALEAAEIYKAGWASKIVLTREQRHEEYYLLRRLIPDIREERDYNREILLAVGVPESAIVMIGDEVDNTRAELELIARLFGTSAQAPLILVTSKIHTRRVRVIWNYVSRNQPRAIVRGAREDPFTQNRWWKERRFSMAVLREYLGLVNYWFAFPMG